MVHFLESSTISRCKKSTPGFLLWRSAPQPMATTLVSVETREVVRCEHCRLMQYRTSKLPLQKMPQAPRYRGARHLAPQLVASPPVPASAEAGLQVAGQVREIRRARHLSQRQLAGRMQVPRTYISKIENGKAIPTLGSLERLAAALEVDVCQLVRTRAAAAKRRWPPSSPIRSWPRLPRCCRIWSRCSGRCSMAPCATPPPAAAAPPRAAAAGSRARAAAAAGAGSPRALTLPSWPARCCPPSSGSAIAAHGRLC